MISHCPSRRVHRPAASRFAAALGRLAALSVPLLLAACATGGVRVAEAPPGLFDDARFGPAAEPIDPADTFRLTDQMQEYIRTKILPSAHNLGTREALTDALYARSKLQLEYDATMTRNAAQAFEARSGNCLSLVIMTGAFAKALGLTVTFQEVSTDEMWSRAGDMYFMSGHVNLQLERHLTEMTSRYDRFGLYTVDFMPSQDSVGLHVHSIKESTILAMYMNNRAAEAMTLGHLDDAYWRARQAMQIDPSFMSAYNTLAVVYLRHGDPANAERVLRFVVDREPDNARVLANHAQALHQLGRDVEEKAVRARLATLEPYPPFHFFNLGQAALKAGDLHAARAWFKRELDRSPDYHEFHYWLAIADFGLGQIDEARSELSIALQDAVKRSDHDLYAAKLDKLRAYRQSSVQ